MSFVCDNSLTICCDSTEVLLQLGHVEGTVQRFKVDFVIDESSCGEVRIGGMETDGTRGNAAGHLQKTVSGNIQKNEVIFKNF